MRYFIEVAYKGTRFSGFQVQENAVTVQSEVAAAFETIHRKPVMLTGSSRTDAGVHALQNYFHFDFADNLHPQALYKMNAVLPPDIVVKNIHPVPEEAHSRFDAVSRAYEYRIYRFKDPFLRETAYYFPYNIDMQLLQEAAALVLEQTDFWAFAKTNSQVRNFSCRLTSSYWRQDGDLLIYNIEGNRFLRGMVRLLTATQLKVARGVISMQDLERLFGIEREKCGFSVPACGLFLKAVRFPQNFFPQ